MIALPGFMDSHIHIETTLLTPEALATVIVPWGSTTLFVDAMEIANVAGMRGLVDLLKEKKDLPFPSVYGGPLQSTNRSGAGNNRGSSGSG